MQTHSEKVNIDQSRWNVSSQRAPRLARMAMPHVAPPQPAPDAAVIRTGRRRLWQVLPGFLLLTAAGVGGLVALVLLVVDALYGEYSAGKAFGTLLLLVFGALGGTRWNWCRPGRSPSAIRCCGRWCVTRHRPDRGRGARGTGC